jgi:hypothetical protein
MHDIDRSFLETETETYENSFELSGEGEGEGEAGYEMGQEGEAYEGESFAGEAYEGESFEDEVLGEGEVERLAAELLSLNSEHELDRFLGSLIKKVGRAAGQFVKSPLGQQLTGALKNVAKKALPIAGAALGNMIVPGVGGMIGGNLASKAGSLFGLELEGLSNEDQQFEVAKQFVRLAADASKNALSAAAAQPAPQAVQQGLTEAAQRFAPGMLQPRSTGASSGRWVRRGNRIVLYGV